ncbi:MAG: ADP-ribosylglycohydrolase family protein, partial [Flavobacteriaceae bacterium]|nr:ADP-ribosylglycohydrolase family protein [Flavobacteriaceae bacterium]
MSCVDSKINSKDFFEIDRQDYLNKLEGFWLGQSIANWTGLITEMDKIGNVGEIKTGNFYTRENWNKNDEPNIWSPNSEYETIDFVLR